MFKKVLFKIWAKLNRLFIPSLTKMGADINNLKTWQKLLLAYRYWVTKNSLD